MVLASIIVSGFCAMLLTLKSAASRQHGQRLGVFNDAGLKSSNTFPIQNAPVMKYN